MAAAAYLILFADTFKTVVGKGEMWRNSELASLVLDSSWQEDLLTIRLEENKFNKKDL